MPAAMVYPFAAAVATLFMPTMPLAPGRFTRTSGTPSAAASRASIILMPVSTGPPGVAGTTTCMGRAGKSSCSRAMPSAVTIRAIAAQTNERIENGRSIAQPFLSPIFSAAGSDPAILGNIEDYSVRILEFALEVAVAFVTQIEEELAARRLDALLRVGQIVDLEAKVICPDGLGGVALDVVALAAGEIKQREIDDAIAQVDRRPDLDIFTADAFEIEDALVEFR